ncbi:MAG: NUDIX hydrolase YfcD [Deltaproteobacteria bacterium]|nr:MAG: NUDIX hydrolase YfcD [Deltaproteobacteria bacterium]
MSTQEEIVVIVDQNNNITGWAPRSEMRAKGLPHRAAYILVFNSKGELYVQKRTSVKDIYPGYFDVAAGGVVVAGESYEESARRELAEELGIRGVCLTRLFDFYHRVAANRVWGRAYRCVYDGKIVLQQEEVESGGFYTLDAVLQSGKHDSYTPDGFYVLQRYLDQRTQE